MNKIQFGLPTKNKVSKKSGATCDTCGPPSCYICENRFILFLVFQHNAPPRNTDFKKDQVVLDKMLIESKM